MPRREDIRNTFWLDLDDFSDDALMLYLWSWTNERCGPAGFYSCPRRHLLEGRFDPDRLDAALRECEAAGKLVYTDGVLWSVTRTKRLGWKTPQAESAINKELAELDRSNPIFDQYVERYQGHPWGKEEKGSLTLNVDGSPGGKPGVAYGSDKGRPTPEQNGSVEPTPHGSPMGHLTHPSNSNGSGNGNSNGEPEASSTSGEDAVAAVFAALGRIAETRRWPFPEEHRVAAAVDAYPDADHVAVASDMEDWLCSSDHGKRQQINDLVQSYRNQLKRKTGSPAGGNGAGEHAEYDAAVMQSG
jgi:hypothetical protein